MVHKQSMIPANTFTSGAGESGDRHSWGYMWVFALVIIFFALIFWGRNNERHNYGLEGIAPALALGSVGNCGHKNNCGENIWDVERDMMNQFAQTRMEAQTNLYNQTRDNDRYFYENRTAIDQNRFDTAIGFKNSEVLGLQGESRILEKISGIERKMDNDRMRALEIENSNYRQTIAIRGLGLIPSVPYAQTPYHFPHHGCTAACDPAFA